MLWVPVHFQIHFESTMHIFTKNILVLCLRGAMFKSQSSHSSMMHYIRIFYANIYIGNSKSRFECIGPLCFLSHGSSVETDHDSLPEGQGFNSQHCQLYIWVVDIDGLLFPSFKCPSSLTMHWALKVKYFKNDILFQSKNLKHACPQ